MRHSHIFIRTSGVDRIYVDCLGCGAEIAVGDVGRGLGGKLGGVFRNLAEHGSETGILRGRDQAADRHDSGFGVAADVAGRNLGRTVEELKILHDCSEVVATHVHPDLHKACEGVAFEREVGDIYRHGYFAGLGAEFKLHVDRRILDGGHLQHVAVAVAEVGAGACARCAAHLSDALHRSVDHAVVGVGGHEGHVVFDVGAVGDHVDRKLRGHELGLHRSLHLDLHWVDGHLHGKGFRRSGQIVDGLKFESIAPGRKLFDEFLEVEHTHFVDVSERRCDSGRLQLRLRQGIAANEVDAAAEHRRIARRHHCERGLAQTAECEDVEFRIGGNGGLLEGGDGSFGCEPFRGHRRSRSCPELVAERHIDRLGHHIFVECDVEGEVARG